MGISVYDKGHHRRGARGLEYTGRVYAAAAGADLEDVLMAEAEVRGPSAEDLTRASFFG